MEEIKVKKFYEKADGTRITFEDVPLEERERNADRLLSKSPGVIRSISKYIQDKAAMDAIKIKNNNYDFDDAS
ncbi:MAG: hypothetical protein ACOWWH_07215 [Eubacteriaceae bacterium]